MFFVASYMIDATKNIDWWEKTNCKTRNLIFDILWT